ncbi:succinate dehydrogenase, hydrophobic membrane anchor protein [Aquabacterium sp.]|uniref:succinate dehydrogenase, hydrophobic membrane anchor protein n=1 Tax=Aquabacterium sp. TaxID=1872578 RepID=UPI0035B42471
MSQNYGTKRIVTGAHYGLRDWLAQRATAIIMAIFTIVLLAQVVFGEPLSYYKWAGIFSSQWMKSLTLVVIVALLVHVWVGVRDIFMDYVKPVSVRLTLHVLTLVWLVGCTGWAIQVLWRL